MHNIIQSVSKPEELHQTKTQILKRLLYIVAYLFVALGMLL